MSDRGNDLSITRTEADKDLTPGFTYEELLDELAAEIAEPEIPSNAITVRMLMERTGKGKDFCHNFLEAKVLEGKMKSIKTTRNKWYYPANGNG